MTDSHAAIWKGESGKSYMYTIYRLDDEFTSFPANYIFAKRVRQHEWEAVYIGQTEDLGDRLANHERRECAIRNGATSIHAHETGGGESVRKREEQDLIDRYDPHCNRQ